jgi:hypothetical protein
MRFVSALARSLRSGRYVSFTKILDWLQCFNFQRTVAISTTVPKRLCCLALTVEVGLIIPTNDGDAARQSSIGNAVASASSKEQLITR